MELRLSLDPALAADRQDVGDEMDVRKGGFEIAMTERAAIEIHDSTLERVDSINETLVATVLAYVHRTIGRPGVDAGTGWSQRVEIRFHSGRIVESSADLPMQLLSGRIRMQGETMDNVIPVPFLHGGPVTAEFETWNGGHLAIEALAIELVAAGEPEYIEDFTPRFKPG